MNPTIPTSRFYRKRPTPWPVRVVLVVAIVFGIWVDLSRDFGTDGDAPAQPSLLGLDGDHSFMAGVVRSLAARR